MTYTLIAVDEFAAYHQHPDVLPFAEKWQQDAARVLQQDQCYAYQFLNLISGFPAERPCFTADPYADEQPHPNRRPELTWEKTKDDWRYWRNRKLLMEAIQSLEITLEPDNADHARLEKTEEADIA